MNKRNTIQKQLVLNSIKILANHPTAEEIYNNIILHYPGISKATVYRNLNNLAEEGLLLRLKVPDGADKYDITTASHYHAVCSGCGKFVDLELAGEDDGIDISRFSMKDFTVEDYSILFRGLCKDCRDHKK